MNCYFSKSYFDYVLAGNKAKCDMEDILEQGGFKNIGIKRTFSSNKIANFLRTLYSVVKCVATMRRGDVVFMQYPLKKYYNFITSAARIKGVKTIVLIHDLGCFRRKRLSVESEIKRLNGCASILAHNSNMKQWLVESGCDRPIIEIEIWDYLSSTTATQQPKFGDAPLSILYAGVLRFRKNEFLYNWSEYISSYQVNLYGKGFDINQSRGDKSRYSIKGFIPSDRLIEEAVGDFGLVWDGDSLDGCSGDWGEYLKYNNPHKCSLYIRCERPIIIWKMAAMARFVEENNIGITIDSLKELDVILPKITSEEYNEMLSNVKLISSRLSRGYYVMKAVNQALEAMK